MKTLIYLIIVVFVGFSGHFLSGLSFFTLIFPGLVSKSRSELIYQWLFRGSIGLTILGLTLYIAYGLVMGKYNGLGMVSAVVFVSVFCVSFGYSIYSFYFGHRA